MTHAKHMVLGWGLVAAVTMSAVIGLPMLAEATSGLKEEARWQERAEDFAAAETAAHIPSALSQNLAAVHLNDELDNPWIRDASVTEGVNGEGLKAIAKAKSNVRQLQCLSEAIYYEARSETPIGQKAVAQVVLNRVSSKHFPNSVCGVVYQGAERTTGCQFSFTCDGSTSKLPRGKSWAQSQAIAKHMIMGASLDVTNRATHYHTTDVDPVWSSSLRQTRKYDTHVFYRFMPRSVVASMRRAQSIDAAP